MESEIKFTKTKQALENFLLCLKCMNCKNLATDPTRFVNCLHFFCKDCATKQNSECSVCGIPVQPNEKVHDFFIENLIKCCTDFQNIFHHRDRENSLELASAKEIRNHFLSSNVRRNSTSTINSKDTNGTEVVLSKRTLANINKPNRKGETPLHAAVVKGNENLVKALLNAGANPNTKDYAKLSPLFEAASYNYYEICKMLLQAGALPDTPSCQNKTSLHEAVIKNSCSVAELLLQYGASKTCRDEKGKTPEDYCTTSEMQGILNASYEVKDSTTEINKNLDVSMMSVLSNCDKLTLFPVNLTKETMTLLQKAAVKHNMNIVSSYKNYVSCVLVKTTDYSAELTYDICLAILHGKWLLSFEWIQLLLDMDEGSNIDLEIFELRCIGSSYNTPSNARENAQRQNPGLFNNCHFYFALNDKSTYIVGNLTLTKKSISNLAIAGEGKILTREPKVEDITDSQFVPFHASHNCDHPLYKCTHYIIYEPGRDEPRVKYNMKHLKTLPLVWFVDSIEKFQLMNPIHYGL